MRSLVRYPLVAAMACAAAFAALLLIAYEWAAAAHLDASALNQFIELRSTLSTGIAEVALASVSVGVAFCFIGLLWALRSEWGSKRRVLTALGVLISANVTAQILKLVLSHPRFDPVLGPDQIGAAAFPSGHATAAMSLAVVCVLVSPRPRRPAAAACSIIYVSAVSLSLFVLGWHFPSDVFGGMLVATGFGCLALSFLGAAETATAPSQAIEATQGSGLEEWAAGVLALALVGALLVGAALARAGDLAAYAQAHTASAGMAMLVVAIGASLLGGFAALARE